MEMPGRIIRLRAEDVFQDGRSIQGHATRQRNYSLVSS